MGENCCGGSHKRRGFGVYTSQYEHNIEMSNIRNSKLNSIYEKLSAEDKVILNAEFYSLNKVSNDVIANNHLLRGKILELESQVEMLNFRISLVRGSSSISEAKNSTYFPRSSEFTKIND